MILPSNHVCNTHLNIIDNNRKVVERMAVGSNQHQVFDVGVVAFLRAVNDVVETRNAALGNFEADGGRLTGSDASKSLFHRQVAIRIEVLSGGLVTSAVQDSRFDCAVVGLFPW